MEGMSAGPKLELALVFLFLSIFIGAIVSHILSRVAPWLPYTPTLLIVGVLVALVDQFAFTVPHIHESLELWENMDGHFLLYVFLPPLLFADCMNLQWVLVRRCIFQCLTLAGPGVVLGAVMNALFARFVLPYDWDWSLALSYGAVQAATDPKSIEMNFPLLITPPCGGEGEGGLLTQGRGYLDSTTIPLAT